MFFKKNSKKQQHFTTKNNKSQQHFPSREACPEAFREDRGVFTRAGHTYPLSHKANEMLRDCAKQMGNFQNHENNNNCPHPESIRGAGNHNKKQQP